ncbi:MAG TPA: hypothetical protein VGH19_24275 [Verrucomicrobiae bacterium]
MIKQRFALLSLTLMLAFNVQAQTLAPEKLLPSDTLVLITVPDLDKARSEIKSNPASQLYSDPAMQPFLKKVLGKWNSDIIAPMEKELGIKFDDYLSLAKGQFTLALIRDGWDGSDDKEPAGLLMIDSKDKATELDSKLAALRKRWTETGKQVKTEKIRDVDFYTVVIPPGEMDKIFTNAFPRKTTGEEEEAEPAEKKDKKPTEITIGRSGSLFLMGESKRVFEKILIKQSGGSLPSLDEVPNYQSTHNAMFRDSMFHVWVNVQSIYDITVKMMAKEKAPAGEEAMPMPSPDKIMEALGLRGLKTLAVSGKLTGEGSTVQMHLGIPQDQRKGIFQILLPEQKDSSPPAFVGADVTKFMRFRLDGQKLWKTIEDTLTALSPQMGGLLQMTLGAAGKDKDPNFDLKKQLIGNLGDDIISYEKAPTGTTLEQLSSPPSIVLVGSPNAEQLANALRTGSSFMVPPSDKPTEREFLGKKIYMAPLPPTPSPDGKGTVEKALHYVASGGYVAFSTEPAMVEEYVRSAQGGGRPLKETAGLAEAAQKVGGMSSGLLVYENQAITSKIVINALRKNPEMFDMLFSGGAVNEEGKKRRAEWFDFTLLPEFSAIEKYFHYSVGGISVDGQGINYKFYGPTPPKAK